MTDVLRLHKVTHFNTATLCYVCDGTFEDDSSSLGRQISLHMAQCHKALCTPTGNYRPEAERSFVCSICLQRFSSNKILTWHVWMQHGVTERHNHNCKICNLSMTSLAELKTHLLSSGHKQMRVTIQSLFVCVDCRTVFPSRDAYAMHMMMRAQNESCAPQHALPPSDVSRRRLSLNENSVNARNGSSLKPQGARSSPNLMNASAARSGRDEGFVCPFCSVQFPAHNALLAHMHNVHPSVSEFLSFQRLVARQSHEQVPASAMGGRGWKCSGCGQVLRSCDDLAMHVMEKHSSKHDTLSTPSVTTTHLPHLADHRHSPSAQHRNELIQVLSKIRDIRTEVDRKLSECQTGSLQRGTKRKSEALDEDLDIEDNSTVASWWCSACKADLPSITHCLEHSCDATLTSSEQTIECRRCSATLHKNLTSLAEHTVTCRNNAMTSAVRNDTGTDVMRTGEASGERVDPASRSSSQDELIDSLLRGAVAHREKLKERFNNNTAQTVSPHEMLSPSSEVPDKMQHNNSVFPSAKELHTDTDSTPEERNYVTKHDCQPLNLALDRNQSETPKSLSSLPETSSQQTITPEVGESDKSLEDRREEEVPLPGATCDGEPVEGEALLEFIQRKRKQMVMCRHCHIVFSDRTMYYLHMGLHNLNNPWQCNLCGKVCSGLHEFSSHVIHYR